jgi:hypothetical protein
VNQLNIDQYLSDINRYKELAEELPEDNLAALLKKIELLAKCLPLIGEVSAEYDRLFKRIHVKRDMDYAQAYIVAPRPKKEYAELATLEIREMEAEAYGRMQKFMNEFDSTSEVIHYLKLRLKVDFADGSIGSRYQSSVN